MQENRIRNDSAMDAPSGMESTWTRRCIDDGWDGLSADVIGRFVEVTGCIHHPARNVLRGHRADLSALDEWIRDTMGHTLVMATTAELWAYYRRQIATGLEPRLLDRLLASMRGFYAYLLESGCRDDDPAACLPDWGQGKGRPVRRSHGPAPAELAHG